MPITLIGEGANILINDAGILGLTIIPKMNTISISSNTQDQAIIEAGAGVSIHELITFCLAHNCSGLEEFSGIPGTVGGAVYINIHYFQFLLSQFLLDATVINLANGNIEQVDNSWFAFGYNTSTLHKREYALLYARFILKKVSDLECAFAQGRHHEIIRHRNQRYPTSGTCGSFFRNFFPHEVTLEQHGKKIIFVAYYLDKIGVKGQLSIGGARVSHQHANMIVNGGSATSHDIITLAQTMQRLVFEQFGIVPQPECQLLGFDHDPFSFISDITTTVQSPSQYY